MTTAPTSVGAGAEEIVLLLLYQLVAIIVATRVVVWISRKYLGQTDVAGEILAGLVLGPSLLGAIAPEAMHRLFDPSTAVIFTGVAQIGLVLLMFQIGQAFEFKSSVTAGNKYTLPVISLAGIVVPFALGFLAAPWFYAQMAEPRPSELGFRLFFATAMSITAIPILGRIFMELGLSHTRTAAITIGAAAIDDVVGWLLLGTVAAIVSSRFAGGPLLFRIGMLAGYVLIVFLLIRPLLRRAIAAHMDQHGRLQHTAISLLLLTLFASAIVTSNLGVFAIIGGFVMGVALHEDRRFVADWKQRVAPLVNTFFLPVFFTYTGLRTDIGSLDAVRDVLEFVLVCLIAFAGKFGGAFVAARAVGENVRSACTIGVCMNTRALMELIALNVGYDLGVLPRKMFTMLVLMAIASTYLATPMIRWLMADERRPERSPGPSRANEPS